MFFGVIVHANNQINFIGEASQDVFAHHILYEIGSKQDPGYYLEIGAGSANHNNNSYAFEKDLGWSGISIDIAENFAPQWAEIRKNPLFVGDATKIDYSSLLSTFPQSIDYLSLDTDGDYATVLQGVLASNHTFKVITIEHDCYHYGDCHKDAERKLLAQYGYILICGDVRINGYPFEDWWIHPDFLPSERIKTLLDAGLNGKEHRDIIQSLNTIITQTTTQR